MTDSAIRRNFATYWLNIVVVAVLGLIANPILLSALGPSAFGVWKSLQRYLDFATIADGRASQALKWIVASRTSYPDQEKRRDIGAAIIVWFRWLPAATLVAIGVTIAVPALIKGIPQDALTAVYVTAAILAINAVLAGLLSVPDSVLVGVNQGYKTMLINTLAFAVSTTATIAAAIAGWPVWSLAVAVFFAAVGNAALTLLVVRKSVCWWGVSRPTAGDLRRVHTYSAWTLGWSIVDKLSLASELIVISVMAGAVMVTQFTFTNYVMQFVLSVSVVSASAFMATLGSQIGASDLNSAAESAKSIRHLVIGLALLGAGAVLAFNGPFVTAWAGGDQFLGTTVNALLALSGFQQALVRLDGQILDVAMRIGPKVIIGALSTVCGIIAGCVVFARTHDLAAALSMLIALRVLSSVSYPVLVARLIPNSGIPWPLAASGLAFLLFSFGVGTFTAGSATSLGAAVALWVLVAGTAAWYALLPRATVRALISRQTPG